MVDMIGFGSTRALGLGVALALLVAAGVWIAAFGDYNGDSGGLAQKPGQAGCVSVDGSGGYSDAAEAGECALARAVGLPSSLVLSRDGRNAYVAAHREAVAILDRDSRSGVLTVKRGPTGCLSRDGTAGGERARRQGQPPELSRPRACTTARALFGVTDVALSPDGRNAYVGSADGVAIFDRDTAGGALTQQRGDAGCLTATGAERGRRTGRRACTRARGLYGARSVTVSPDGRTVYVTSVDVLAFARDVRTGALTQAPGRAACVAATPKGVGGTDCVADPATDGATSVEISPDGRHAYAASGAAGSAGAIAILDRDRASGALTPKPGRAGCVAQSGACGRATGLRGAAAVAVSADGANAYAVSSLGCTVAVFDRERGSGKLTQKAGAAGSATRHGDSGACDNRGPGDRSGFTGGSVTLSPDGRTVFVTARAGVAMYARDPRGGALRYEGCVSDDGEGTCEDVKALNIPISPVVSPDGRDLYIAARGGDALAAFDIPRGGRRR